MAGKDEIKSTKDVIDEKLEDKKFGYGAEQFYERMAEQLTDKLPKKTNRIKTILKKRIYDCFPDDGIHNISELDGLVETIYSTTSKIVAEELIGLEPIDGHENGEEGLANIVKTYIGNLSKKDLKRQLEQEFKQTGYIDTDTDLIRKNILTYPVNTYSQQKHKKAIEDIEEKLEESKEEFERFQKYIKSLGTSVNKEIADNDIFIPGKAINKWLQLVDIRKSLQKL